MSSREQSHTLSQLSSRLSTTLQRAILTTGIGKNWHQTPENPQKNSATLDEIWIFYDTKNSLILQAQSLLHVRLIQTKPERSSM